MANNILSTVELIEKANAILSKHSTYLDQAASSLGKYVNNAKLPSEYINSLKSIDAANKNITKSSKALEVQEKKMQRERVAELKLQAKREKAFDNYEKQLVREEKLLAKTSGLYNKVQAGINSATKQYQDLALRKELNGKLTAEELVSLGQLEGKLNKYQSALKRVDANIGKHTRNVGNYKSGFDGLGWSVAQLSREMPAFANSMQTGFMAISNNIPMLVDEVTKLKVANTQLAASGKPTVNILKQVGKAIFSMNGLLGIGITILTVFGPKLIEWATGMSDAEKATQKATEELEEQNKALKENIELRSRQIASVREFLNDPEVNAAFKSALADDDTEKANLALIELSERLQKIGAKNADSLKDQELSTRDRLNIAGNLLEIETQRGKLEAERARIDDVQFKKNELDKKVEEGKISAAQRGFELRKLGSSSLEETLNIQARINQLEEENISLIGRKVELENKDNGSSKKKTEERIALEIKSGKEAAAGVNSLTKEVLGQIKVYEDVLAITPKMTQEYFFLEKQIENLKETLTGIDFDIPMDALTEWSKEFEKNQKKIAKIHKFYADQRQDYEKEISDNIRGIASSLAQSVVDMMINKQYEEIEAEERALETRYDNAILFAEDNAAAQAAINVQRAKEEEALAEKKAETEKRAFLFQQAFKIGEIAIDTIQKVAALKAQAAVLASNPATAALASVPLANIPLVIGAGATAGAAVLASSIPAFKDGVENFSGGAAILGDGGKHEYVTDQKGKLLGVSDNKDTLYNLPKGANVLPDYDAFINSLDSELLGNNIMPIGQSSITPMIVDQGLTKREVMDVINSQTSSLISTIKGQHGVNISIDENGINKYVTKKGTKTKVMNARYSGKGISV